MNEKPILFSGEMVRAILEKRKTQTRRMVKPDSSWTKYFDGDKEEAFKAFHRDVEPSDIWNCGGIVDVHWQEGDERLPQNYQVGQRLYVKETHIPKASGVLYRADYSEVDAAGLGGLYGGWKPSIFMRRVNSRIMLDVTGVRVERLMDISDADCEAEGMWSSLRPDMRPKGWQRRCYADTWGAINGAESWFANPLVWVISFQRLKTPGR